MRNPNIPSPLVSVWMITYNHGDYVRQALDSVLCQVVDFEFEVVIGDDCSTDETKEVILEFQQRFPGKLKVLFHPENIGMIANQNAVFAACSGKYIAMLEGDDYWTDENKLAIQVQAMEKYPTCNLSFHPCRETKHWRRMSWYGAREKFFPTSEVIIRGGYFSPTPSLMLRRSVIEHMPEFLNSAPAGDYYLQILGSLGGGALYIPRVMCTYRVNATGSWSSTVKSLQTRQSFRQRSIDMIELMDAHLSHEYHDAFQHRAKDILLLIAFDHLRNGQMEKFNECLEQFSRKPGPKRLKFRVMKLLRNFPTCLITLRRILHVVRESKQKLFKLFEGNTQPINR